MAAGRTEHHAAGGILAQSCGLPCGGADELVRIVNNGPLVDAWALTRLGAVLVRGPDTRWANIAEVAGDTARHIATDPESLQFRRILPVFTSW